MRACGLAVVLLAHCAAAIPVFSSTKPADTGARWAVLVAGSNTYMNYRHQADVSHAYQILSRAGGVPASNIITFMFDDIANSAQNPNKGEIINKPNGPNVYPGTDKIDYKGNDVTPANFLNALTGGATLNNTNAGKVLQSGPNDDVFVFFSDHGAPGLVAFPTTTKTQALYAKDLIAALTTMQSKKMFKSLVFYLESCESGSMFANLIPKGMSVYAVTASAPSEPSYATYYDAKRGTYLGDLFSVAYLEDSDSATGTETLLQQFATVKKKTNQSTAEQYGDLTVDTQRVDDWSSSVGARQASAPSTSQELGRDKVSSRDVVLVTLQHRLAAEQAKLGDAAGSQSRYLEARARVEAEVASRAQSDKRIRAVVAAVGGDASSIFGPVASISQWECYKANMDAYETACGAFDDYSLQYAGALANLCEAGFAAPLVAAAASHVCA